MAAVDSAHPIQDPVRNGPLGFNLLVKEVRSLKTTMYLLMDHLVKIRAENRTLSSDVRKLMKSQDYNFDQFRRELGDVKAVLDFESLGQQPCESPENGVSPDAEVLSNSDMVDVATLMRNGALSESTPPSNKKEITQIESNVEVKQEEMDSDYPLFQPSASVASTSSEQNVVVSTDIPEEILQGDSSISRMETEECEKRNNEVETRKTNDVPVPYSKNRNRFSYCAICRRRVLSIKYVLPTIPRKLKIFLQCATQTMDQGKMDSFLARIQTKKSNRDVCESHVPGYKEAASGIRLSHSRRLLGLDGRSWEEEEDREVGGSTVNEVEGETREEVGNTMPGSSSLLEWEKRKMNEGTVSEEFLESIGYGVEKGGNSTKRRKNTYNISRTPQLMTKFPI